MALAFAHVDQVDTEIENYVPNSPQRFRPIGEVALALRWLGVVVVGAATVLGLQLLASSLVQLASHPMTRIPQATVPYAVHRVERGDTLWSIAGDIDASGDRRLLVDRLARMNGGSSLQVGQVLRLPLDGR